MISCAFAATSCGPSAASDTSATDAAAVQALDEQWSATAAKNDLEGTVAFYADDAGAPSSECADRKRPEVDPGILKRDLLGPDTAVSWKVSKVEVAKSRRTRISLRYLLAIDEGSGRRSDGVSNTGKLVEIWKKQADGKWRCIVDTYNSDLPAAPAPEAKK